MSDAVAPGSYDKETVDLVMDAYGNFVKALSLLVIVGGVGVIGFGVMIWRAFGDE